MTITNSEIYKKINRKLGTGEYSITKNIYHRRLFILGNKNQTSYDRRTSNSKKLQILPMKKFHAANVSGGGTLSRGGTKIQTVESPLFCKPHYEECSLCSDSEDEFCIPTKLIRTDKRVLSNKLRTGMKKKTIIKEEFDRGGISATTSEFQDLMSKCFKVNGPYENDVWLSDKDIMSVLKQFRLKFPTFVPIKFQMIDFIDYENDLKNLELHNLVGKKVGCVLNTDTNGGKGEHWFCLFFDLKNSGTSTIEYFDSTQRPPHVNIIKFLKDKANVFRRNTKNPVKILYIYKKLHQSDSDSCGVYSLYYIWLRLNDVPPSYLSENQVRNNSMYQFRKMLFDR